MSQSAQSKEPSDLPEPSGAADDVMPAMEASKADPAAAAKKEAADNHDRYLRAMADLENFRRRAAREKDELRLFAASRLIEDLLPALDNLALGLAAARQPNADVKTVASGVEPVLQQLKTALANHGLKEINPAGQPFDPHQHEAISHQASDAPAEQVVTVVRPGFSLNGRLLRPASVIVSSGSAR
ncbi:MAG TPA: nucleotide exchange factor GrpE [Opitutaceae bacterium]|jgi:molecular chaperone GrpE|nr:nucleotide exchange factor GrpE [Opitutaceae bacterium]